MELKRIIEEKSQESWEIYLPSISIDCVVFGFHDGELKVLVLRMKGKNLLGLPGGYVEKRENLNEAAIRILKSRTGAENIYLNQFSTFGDLDRSEGFFEEYADTLWNKQRFISVGFYALVDYSKVNLVIDTVFDPCEWVAIEDLTAFMMDHNIIFNKALETLRLQLNHKPIGHSLLPEKFTMPELQKLYEIILGKKLNRGNFYRKMLRYDILEKLDESRKGGAHKAPDLYKFDVEKYQLALKNGLNEGW
ncbi:NUDIX hydrolase [Flavobacterium muglaense]|uniref:NUDIX hydrolase n=1 Tax=Flavobacterium muglaense TaxID=2764716 RepID=A0A923MXC9_9FLAO|nr:NUDIX domain-containing protein [Flavobacterium muglaense]MBC5836818.1 NUDIX hydrolase [Flavobacterium muglaense]MBC5843232.1 NUDIX hydrolase [Flavobacterium muglaense]